MIKLSVCCCTYNRPHLLGEMIASFEMQTYPKDCCELIVLDDAGQYGDLCGDNWQVVSFPRRFASIGEKRNACVSLTLPDFTHIVIADDDDIYLPWWLKSHATNFERGAKWSFASIAWLSENNQITGKWHYESGNCLMHPGTAIEKSLFWEVGGYPHLSGWEDREFYYRLYQHDFSPSDALEQSKNEPYLIYRRFDNERHLTDIPLNVYQNDFQAVLEPSQLQIGWKRNYSDDVRIYENSVRQSESN